MRDIFSKQLHRTIQNIYPFIWLGLFSGILIGNAGSIQSNSIVQMYMQFNGIETDLANKSTTIFLEHFAPNTLFVIWISVLFFSAIHRILFGATESKTILSIGFIVPLENFGSLLAIAWLGLMLGMVFPAFYFDGFAIGVSFLFLCLYPVIYLVEMTLFVRIISWHGISQMPFWPSQRSRWKLRTRLEGIFIFSIAVAYFVFQSFIIMLADTLL